MYVMNDEGGGAIVGAVAMVLLGVAGQPCAAGSVGGVLVSLVTSGNSEWSQSPYFIGATSLIRLHAAAIQGRKKTRGRVLIIDQ